MITATASSIGTVGQKFTTSKKVCNLLSDTFHPFASFTNEDGYMTLCLILFKIGCIIFTKYFKVPYDADPTFENTALMA